MDPAVLTIFVVAILMLVTIASGHSGSGGSVSRQRASCDAVVAGAVVVLAAPPELRRPVAFAATTLASAIALTAVTVPALAWFAPVLLIKLLLGHLLPGEAASRGGV